MSMNKIVKTTSLQSGSFTATKNLIDFDLHGGRQYDLRNAYVNLEAVVSQTDVSGDAVIFNWGLQWTNDGGATPLNLAFDNCALVKNARLTSSKKGLLEDIRRSDILRTQLKAYSRNEDDYRGTLYKAVNQPTNQNNIRLAPNIEFKAEGTQKSRLNNVNVQIPLKDIFELGNSDNLPCDKLGDCRIHLEMNLDKVMVKQAQGAGTAGTEFGNPDYVKFENSLAGVSISSVQTKEAFLDIANSPYWVGQKLSFSGTGAGTGPPANMVSQPAIITSIAKDATTNKLTLTLDRTIFTAGAGEFQENIVCDGVNWSSMELTWTDAELVVEEKGKTEPVGELEYMTYTNEEDNGNGLTAFSRQYGVEQECFNLMVCLPDSQTGLLCGNATKSQYSNYRLRLDNKDLTNRQVDTYSPLYYDRIAMYMLNQNLPLKNLIETNTDILAGFKSRFSASTRFTYFVGNPLPITPKRKLVQININGTGVGVNEIQLFKSVVRNIKL